MVFHLTIITYQRTKHFHTACLLPQIRSGHLTLQSFAKKVTQTETSYTKKEKKGNEEMGEEGKIEGEEKRGERIK